MNKQHLILVILWIAYGFIHSVMAASTVKTFSQRSLRISSALYRLIYNFIALAGLILLIRFQFSIKSPYLFELTALIVLFALLSGLGGLSMMIMIVLKYFKQMSGIKKSEPVLEISGVHSHVRHPLYAATFLFITGLFLLFPSLANLISVIVIIGYTLIAIKYEEKKLVKIFGDRYRSYKKKVPKIFPRFKT